MRSSLAKAAEQARATEKARVAAELAKKAEEAKVAEAERAKTAALATATEDAKAAARARVAAELVRKAEEAKLAEAARVKSLAVAGAAEDTKAETEAKARDGKAVGPVAALQPADQTPAAVTKLDQPLLADIPRLLQTELRRVGCNSGSVDGNWNAAAQKSLDLFNKSAGVKLDLEVASIDALDAVKAKPGRICPLICDHGYKADGEHCTKITCRAGYEVGDDNTCEKIEVKKPAAKRDEPKRERPERAKTEAAPAKPQASGQVFCGAGGCRPVQKGCRLEVANTWRGTSTPQEVCN